MADLIKKEDRGNGADKNGDRGSKDGDSERRSRRYVSDPVKVQFACANEVIQIPLALA